MARLGGVDASFLYLETPETPMHVAGLTLYELPKDFKGTFYDHFRVFFTGRLHMIPVFGMKLAQTLFNLDHPGWVDDPDIDLDYHIRREILPSPGNFELLEALVARMHSQVMDRSRPLWQFVVIEGLADGRVALYSKVHHAAVDGGAGMVITKALYDVTPVPRHVEPPPPKTRIPAPPPDLASSISDLMTGFARQHQAAMRALPEVLSTMAKVLAPPAGKDAKLADLFPNLLAPKLPQLAAPKTIFNVTITSHRSYAARSVSLGDAKLIAKATGTKINDVVMAVCGGALRKYLSGKGALPDATLLAFVPISLREAGNTDLNNQVSGMICPIGTDIADPLERLQAIKRGSSEAKETASLVKDVMPQDFTFVGAPVIISGLMSLYARSQAADWMMSPANIAISNTQGPPVSIYCAGARVAALYPVSIPAHGMALNMTVQSYCGQLDFGLTGDKKAVPDIEALADELVNVLAELKAAAGLEEAEKPAAAPAPAPKAKKAAKDK